MEDGGGAGGGRKGRGRGQGEAMVVVVQDVDSLGTIGDGRRGGGFGGRTVCGFVRARG